MSITNYSNFNGQASNSYPKQNKIRSWQYVDHANLITGKHDVRFGYENFHNTNTFISGSTSVGTFTFNGNYTGTRATTLRTFWLVIRSVPVAATSAACGEAPEISSPYSFRMTIVRGQI